MSHCKCFYSSPDLEDYIDGETRHSFNAKITEQDLEEVFIYYHYLLFYRYSHQTYFPAFKACVQGANVASIMCSYNEVNGVPSCANDQINNKLARDSWGFDGFIVSYFVHVYKQKCKDVNNKINCK